MKGKILLITFAVGLLLILTNSEKPEDRCTIEGQVVCVNCHLNGTCHQNSDNIGFYVENATQCDESEFCIESEEDLSATCYRTSQSTCYCTGSNICIADPYTEDLYIPCNGTYMNITGTEFVCAVIDVNTCNCLQATASPSESPPTSTESSLTTTEEPPTTTEEPTTTTEEPPTTTEEPPTTTEEPPTTTEELPTTTEEPPTTTEEPPTTTEEPPTTTEAPLTITEAPSTITEAPPTITVVPQTITEAPSPTEIPPTTTTEPTCTDECPFTEDNRNPNDCGAYFQCTDAEPIPGHCPDSLCFNEDLCQCLSGGTTTQITCSDDCPYVDIPNEDDCSKYYYCSGSQLVPYQCSDSRCFDQESCGCIVTTSATPTTSTTSTTSTISTLTTTSTTTTYGPVTCPTGCPFLDYSDPDAPCQNFYICSNGELIPNACPNDLCFDQDTCQCVA